MGLFGKIGGALVVGGAALAGNLVGDLVRSSTTGEPGHKMSLLHSTPEGQAVFGLNLTLTNFAPAVLLALLAGKPRTIYAFVGGALISALVGDGYERAATDWIQRHLGNDTYSTDFS